MAAESPEATDPSPGRWPLIETALIFLLFVLYGAWPAPEVNEAHYLAKARHYWDPSWAANDFFLNSADAHLVFYWTFGWITRLLSLTASAWVGRVLTWGLLAWAWRRLSVAVVPRRTMSVLTAAGFLGLIHFGHMAGEWVIGGVEAKGFAFVCVILALEAIVKNRWRTAWLLVGGAAAFHVLVGGWSAIAIGVAWLCADRERTSLWKMAPAMLGGAALSLFGLVPALALSWGVEPEMVAEANQVYVFERLAHHLTIRQMEPLVLTQTFKLPSVLILRHIGLIIAWAYIALALRGETRLRRIQGFVVGAVAIAACGLVIDLATWDAPEWGAKLLRYYWYRLSDAFTPMGISLSLAVLIARLWDWKKPLGEYALVWSIAACALFLTITTTSRWGDLRPAADRQTLPRGSDLEQTRMIYEKWLNVCAWMKEHVPADAVVITPRRQQTFTWRTGLAEVVNWKNVPQNAGAIVEWKQRIDDVYPAEYYAEEQWFGLTAQGKESLEAVAHKYGAEYLLVDRTLNWRRPGFARLYPLPGEPADVYEVYWIPPASE